MATKFPLMQVLVGAGATVAVVGVGYVLTRPKTLPPEAAPAKVLPPAPTPVPAAPPQRPAVVAAPPVVLPAPASGGILTQLEQAAPLLAAGAELFANYRQRRGPNRRRDSNTGINYDDKVVIEEGDADHPGGRIWWISGGTRIWLSTEAAISNHGGRGVAISIPEADLLAFPEGTPEGAPAGDPIAWADPYWRAYLTALQDRQAGNKLLRDNPTNLEIANGALDGLNRIPPRDPKGYVPTAGQIPAGILVPHR